MTLINNLNKLLLPWMHNAPHCLLKKIVLDSRKITNNDLFIAIKGNKFNGIKFIPEAIKKGAIAILADTNNIKNHEKIQIIHNKPIIHFFNLKEHLSAIAGRFYQNPGKKMITIGVTGTNGKTTVTHLIAQWANLLGNRSAIIGTLGNGIYNHHLQKTNNTTDSAIDIQSVLYSFLKKKINLVTIEISSHGIQQNRVKNIPFSIGIFTNISQDHLDYHKNMNVYIQEKWNFFQNHKINQKIFYNNDIIKYHWFNRIKYENDILVNNQTYSKSINSKKWINTKKIIYEKNNIKIFFDSFWGVGTLTSHLLGSFNINNILLACSSLLSLGYSINSLSKTSNLLTPIQGRMQKIKKNGKPNIIIDYAHTPDALKKVLKSIRYHYHHKLWCIFGCGGDRDKIKRSKMGIIAEKLADKVIITNDNPRNENPIKIAKDITKYCKKNIKIIFEREEAIAYAINAAKEHDTILIAGKGHEQYQIINNKYIKYSDEKTVSKLLETNL